MLFFDECSLRRRIDRFYEWLRINNVLSDAAYRHIRQDIDRFYEWQSNNWTVAGIVHQVHQLLLAQTFHRWRMFRYVASHARIARHAARARYFEPDPEPSSTAASDDTSSDEDQYDNGILMVD